MITCVNFWEATEQTHNQADRQAGREHTSTNKSLDIIACSLTHRHDDSHIFGLYRTITNTHIGLWFRQSYFVIKCTPRSLLSSSCAARPNGFASCLGWAILHSGWFSALVWSRARIWNMGGSWKRRRQRRPTCRSRDCHIIRPVVGRQGLQRCSGIT